MEIQRRLDSLERTVQRWRVISILVAGGLMLAVTMGLHSPKDKAAGTGPIADVVRARAIEVVNKKGKVVFSVSTDAIGGGVISLKFGDGKSLLSVATGDFGQAGLALHSSDGKPVLLLRQSDNGGGMLKLLSKEMTPILVASDDKNDQGQIILASEDGKTLRTIGLNVPSAAATTESERVGRPSPAEIRDD